MAKKARPRRKKVESVFSKNFQKVLDERGLTLKQAAELSGVSISTCADWVSGSNPNNLTAVGDFCRKLSIDFEWLVLGRSSNKPLSEIPINELFDEQDVGLSGLFKISAVRLTKKEQQ